MPLVEYPTTTRLPEKTIKPITEVRLQPEVRALGIEHEITPEMVTFIEDFRVGDYNHEYQPIRNPAINNDPLTGGKPIFDISGKSFSLYTWDGPARESDEDIHRHYEDPYFGPRFHQPVQGGYNDKIVRECYEEKLNLGITESPQYGLGQYPSITDWIKGMRLDLWRRMRPVLANKNVFGGTPTQVILPHYPELAPLLIKLGSAAFQQDYGKPMQGMWLPEGAADNATLDLLPAEGINFTIIHQDHLDTNGRRAALYVKKTPHGPLFMFPYFGDNIGFSNGLWSDSYAADIEQRDVVDGVSAMSAHDSEAIGHWKGIDSLKFAQDYFRRKVKEEIEMGRMNYKRDISMALPAQLKPDIQSWSCPHGGGRWNGANNCNCTGDDPRINEEKQYLSQGIHDEVLYILDSLHTLGANRGVNWEDNFQERYLRERVKLATGVPIDFSDAGEFQDLEERLIASICAAQSCAFFYSDDYGRAITRQGLPYLQARHERSKRLGAT